MAVSLAVNFPCDHNNAMAIRDILLQDIELLRNWLEIKDYFLLNIPDKLEIETMQRSGRSISDIILKTLTLWIKNSGSLATFEACLEILLKKNYVMSAENLRERQTMVRSGFSQNSKLTPVWFQVDLPCYRFTGRVNELENLHGMLTKNDKILDGGIELRFAVISGLGGVGKTTLARAYAHKYKHSYNNAVWINAETKRSILNSFRELTKHLRMLQIDIPNEVDFISFVMSRLYPHLSSSKTLIIFDNAEDFKGPDGIRRFFPRELSNSVYILVTTRKLDLTLDGEILTLDILTEFEAIEFMLKWFRIEHDLEEIRRLCRLLQFLPLALEQAGAFIARMELLRAKRPGSPTLIGHYIQNYETNARIILDNKYFQQLTLTTYEKTTLVTWRNTFDRIQKEFNGELAIELMEVIAYLGSDNIPAKLLMNIRHIRRIRIYDQEETVEVKKKPRNWLNRIIFISCWRKEGADQHENNINIIEESQALDNLSDEDVDQCLDLLKSYSMISELEGGISVHRLVQQTVQIHIGSLKESQVLRTSIQIFEITLRVDSFDSFQAKCTQHSIVLLKKLESRDRLLIEFPSFASTVCRLLDHCAYYDELLAVTKMLGQKYNILFGENSQNSIEMVRHCAWALRRLSQFDDAIDTIEQVLPISLNSLGSKHWLTLDLKNIKASILRGLNRLSEAEDIFNDVIEGYLSLEGENSLNVITVLHNKAGCMAARRNHVESADLYRRIYNVRRVTLGEDHPFNLSTKYGLATQLSWQLENNLAMEGSIDREEVLRMFMEVNQKFGNTLGNDHPQTLKTASMVIYCLLKLGGFGAYELAEQMGRQFLESQIRIFGENHPEALLTRHNLAVSIAKQGRTLEALNICEELYPLLKERLGESHQTTSRSAWWTEKLKKEVENPLSL